MAKDLGRQGKIGVAFFVMAVGAEEQIDFSPERMQTSG